MRLDKKARDITRETPASQSAPAPDVVRGVRVTHPDRIVYPDLRLTKLDVARYYDSVAEWIVPHLRGRPLTLVRCPEGLRGGCFFMKHSKVWAPSPLKRVHIQEKRKVGEYLIADDAAGAIALVQMGVLEVHTWNSDVARLEYPNRVVLDLDPGDQVSWRRVVEAARAVKGMLDALGLVSFVKTTGGNGVHIVVPLEPHADWNACLGFTRALAETIERTAPDVYTTNFGRAGRRRKILVDYLRNNRTNTSVAAFSTRAKPQATVSVPLAWRELTASLDPTSFTVLTVPKRLIRLRKDPWAEYWTTRQKLTRAMMKAAGVERG
jgi:bifunctional non-homologous end joining protein LigD